MIFLKKNSIGMVKGIGNSQKMLYSFGLVWHLQLLCYIYIGILIGDIGRIMQALFFAYVTVLAKRDHLRKNIIVQ